MRSIRSLAAAAAVLAMPLTVICAETAGSAPASAATSGTGFTWHKLTTLHGWQPGTNLQLRYGSPAWALVRGVVYLRGSVDQPTGTNPAFARLPLAARPAHRLYITVQTINGTAGYLIVFPDGIVEAKSSPSNDARGFTSLASVSFPARSMTMHKLNLEFGWQSSQAQKDSGDPGYAISNGVAYLSGSLHQPSGTDPVFAVLPKAARPSHVMYIGVYTNAGAIGEIAVEPNGTVQALLGQARSFTSLAGVSYPVAKTVKHKLTLWIGWTSDLSTLQTGNPSYSLIGGVVYLSGAATSGQGSSEVLAVLPKGTRPSHTLYIKAYRGNNPIGVFRIARNGRIFSFTVPPTDGFVSLDSVSFPVTS
jgi:hypothetical protein